MIYTDSNPIRIALERATRAIGTKAAVATIATRRRTTLNIIKEKITEIN